MDCNTALTILELDTQPISGLTLDMITKQYRKLALKYHPDKNGSTAHFQEINEAYTYLQGELHKDAYINASIYSDEEEEEEKGADGENMYINVLKKFILSVIEQNHKNKDRGGVELMVKIVNNILNAGKHISLKLFEDLDKDIALNVYSFLSKYKLILHFDEELLEKVRLLVIQKYNNVKMFKLNPSINDLLLNNVYKLYVDEMLYLVPLWHNELHFDGSGCEIIAICDPELPNNMCIDDNNNLIVEVHVDNVSDILSNNAGVIIVNIGATTHSINLSDLYIKSEQYYYLLKQGLTKIKKDIYDVSEKDDIIIKLVIHF